MRPLRRRLALEARTAVGDGAGGLNEEWSQICEHRVSMRPASAREAYLAGAQVSTVSHVAYMRYAADDDPKRPKADQRFRDGARAFAIRGVSEADDLRRELICWLEEGRLS